MDAKILIEEVIRDLANNQPLDYLVNKILVISRLLENKSFTDWVEYEFTKGYSHDIEVPSYRQFNIKSIQASYISYANGDMTDYSNQKMPIHQLDTKCYQEIMEMTIRDTVSVVQNKIQKDNYDIYYPLNSKEKVYMQEILGDNCRITNIYKVISKHYFSNIIEQVKVQLINFLMNFNNIQSENEQPLKLANKKEDYNSIIINAGIIQTGNGTVDTRYGNVIGGHNNAITLTPETTNQLENIVDRIEELSQEINEDRTNITEAILTIRQELEAPKPKVNIIRTAFNAIKGLAIKFLSNKIETLAEQGIMLLFR